MHVTQRPKRILVAFDGSEASGRALDVAAGLAGYGSSLTIVHVRRNGADAGVVEEARERLLERHVAATYLEPCGTAADEIISAADAIAADLIVVGRRTALRGVLGSVSAAVVDRARCDVLVAR